MTAEQVEELARRWEAAQCWRERDAGYDQTGCARINALRWQDAAAELRTAARESDHAGAEPAREGEPHGS